MTHPLDNLPGKLEPLPDPYDQLLQLNLSPRWTDQQLERHILEAVKYGVAMERDRILSATSKLTYD